MFSGFLIMGIMGYECMQLIADMCVNLQSLKDSLGDGMQQISNKKGSPVKSNVLLIDSSFPSLTYLQ